MRLFLTTLGVALSFLIGSAAAQYNPVYRQSPPGGAATQQQPITVPSGMSITVQSGGSLVCEAGATCSATTTIPVTPSTPDTVSGYFALTTTAGSPNITFAGVGGNPVPAFSSADVGKLLVCTGIGPTEGRLITSIAGVTSATQITTAANATQAMSGVSQRCVFGSDQTANIQAAFTTGTSRQVGSYVQGGVYLISAGLTCMPPPTANNGNFTGALCQLDPGAVIMAAAPMSAVITYGSIAPDYLGFLRQSLITGGTIDANFVADYAVSIPFSILSVRQNQTTKNAKLAGVKWGDATSPQASAGSQDINNINVRDVNFVPIAGITKSTTPVVTTAYSHGFTTGRVISIDNVGGMTQVNAKFFTITVTGATTFTLNNTDSTGYGTYTSGGTSAQTMPSMRVPIFVSAITNANPGVVSTAVPHGFTNGMQIWLADVSGITLGGIYTVAGVTSTTFQLQGVDTTSLGTYTGQGSAIEYLAPATVTKGFYYENATDADVIGGAIQGTRISIYSDPSTAGYDGKIIKPHVYNYNYDGDIFAGVSLVGDNTITDLQCDGPIRYCVQLSGPNNTVIGSRLNAATGNGVLAAYNNYASFIRLDGGAIVLSIGNGMKGDIGLNVLGEVSVNGGGWSYGTAPGYSSYNVQTRLTSFPQPSTLAQAGLQVKPIGSTAFATISGDQGDTRFYVYDRQASKGGLYIANGGSAARTDFNVIDAAAAYLSTPLRLEENLVSMFKPTHMTSTLRVDGGYNANGSNGVTCSVPAAGATITVTGGIITALTGC